MPAPKSVSRFAVTDNDDSRSRLVCQGSSAYALRRGCAGPGNPLGGSHDAARAVVRTQDLLPLDREQLTTLLDQQLATLPYHRQQAWAVQHLASSTASASATPSKPASLLREIEAFCATSRDGACVSWVDHDGWQGGDDENGQEFQEWTALSPTSCGPR